MPATIRRLQREDLNARILTMLDQVWGPDGGELNTIEAAYIRTTCIIRAHTYISRARRLDLGMLFTTGIPPMDTIDQCLDWWVSEENQEGCSYTDQLIQVATDAWVQTPHPSFQQLNNN